MQTVRVISATKLSLTGLDLQTNKEHTIDTFHLSRRPVKGEVLKGYIAGSTFIAESFVIQDPVSARMPNKDNLKELVHDTLIFAITEERQRRGLSKSMLSEMTDVDVAVISKVESRGYYSSLPTLDRLMKALDLEAEIKVFPKHKTTNE